jgi:Uncharacterised protein family (UPF0236)
MQTNESLEKTLMQVTESHLKHFIEKLHNLEVGDLKGLEAQVMSTINTIGCLIMEATLSATAQEQTPASQKEGACGHKMRLVGMRGKRLQTLMGPVTLWRPYYHCAGRRAGEEDKPSEDEHAAHGEAPADEQWGVQQHRCSVGVQQAISRLCATSTLEEAAETLSHLFPLQMSARQALNLIQPVGEALQEQEEAQQQDLFKQAGQARSQDEPVSLPPDATLRRMYVEIDGVMARLRRGSVPMQDKERKRPGDVYREVKVGAVFEAEPGRKRSELAPGVFVDTAGSKAYVARRGKVEAFAPRLYALAQQRGLAHAQQVVILGDGAPWIWNLVAEHFPTAVQIVDLWHAQQHVWQVANAVFGDATAKGAQWAEQQCQLLEEGNIEALVEAIALLPPIPPPPSSTHSVPEQAMRYFIRNAARMRYPAFRAQGMHIGSGIAEAACKTVVSTRLKRSGMRWTPDGLDALLALRTARLNGTFDAFWEPRFHLVA